MAKQKKSKDIFGREAARRNFYLKPEERERIHFIKMLLEQNPALHLTIPELSKKALMNEFKLKKGFRNLFGKSIYDFLVAMRMNEAKRLMKETDMTLEQIALKVGYEYLSSFIAAFKKLHHTTPGVFRRTNRQQ